MTKLVFLFRDCNKKVVRVTERGFEKTCLLYGVAPCRIAGLNGFCERALKNSLIYIEKCKNSVLYQVKVEDTLEKICARFGVFIHTRKVLRFKNCNNFNFIGCNWQLYRQNNSR